MICSETRCTMLSPSTQSYTCNAFLPGRLSFSGWCCIFNPSSQVKHNL